MQEPSQNIYAENEDSALLSIMSAHLQLNDENELVCKPFKEELKERE